MSDFRTPYQPLSSGLKALFVLTSVTFCVPDKALSCTAISSFENRRIISGYKFNSFYPFRF
jgi:hypothetical protein